MKHFLVPFLCLTACGSDAPFGLTERVEVTGLTFPIDFPSQEPLVLTPAFSNLSFSSPVFLTAPADGTDRLFVVEKAGRIRVFENNSTTNDTTLFLDIASRVEDGGERGLLGMAFDPNYATNGYFYLYYTQRDISPPKHVVSRFTVSSDPNVADGASESILLEIQKPADTNYTNHNGGMIAFGPDGKLYIGVGDGGSGGDPRDHAQNINSPLGKILRIDPALPFPHFPSDNPFVDSEGLDSIWAYGLRNPWRFSFDPNTDRLWVADVGQNEREEISIATKGANLGWRVYEGFQEYTDTEKIPLPNYVPPILDYPHDSTGGQSVTGGYVYRGTEIPSLLGAYVYGDYVSGNIWALTYDGQSLVSNTLVTTGAGGLTSFGEDAQGELYAIVGSSIYRFQEETPGELPPFPQALSETGLFEDVATLTPSPGIIEYEVNSPLWSDNATKRRWLALPGNDVIEFNDTSPWLFPIGTVTVKHFELTQSTGTRRLETRVLVHEKRGWAGYTYQWNEAQTDATLLSGAETESLENNQEWYYPGPTDCLRCHTDVAGRVLGISTRQLNRDFDYSGTTDNQLRAWNHIGLFASNIGSPAEYASLSPLESSSNHSEKSRSYLDSNCSFCHQPLGPTPSTMDMRSATPLEQTNLVDVLPAGPTLNLPDARRISSGVKESSLVWERMRRIDEHRMPPLATTLPDQSAITTIGEWIDNL